MTTRSKRTPKLLSLLLSTCMALSMVPLSALAADGDVAINETNFPDTVFRAYVQKEFDTNKDSVLSEAEIADAKEIKAYNSKISSLKGVEHLTALETLECGGNKLTELDVSKNTALKKLNCNSNQLTQLDVSKNTALIELYCTGYQLTQLDVSKNTALEKLIAFGNPLTQLDVSKNTALTELNCTNTKLTELDVSKNTALTSLCCAENQLTELDISKNTALIELRCGDNQLTQLDVSKNTALRELAAFGNQLTELDVTNNTALTQLGLTNNQVTDLDVTNNTALTQLLCMNNRLAYLDVSNNSALSMLNYKDNKHTVHQRENVSLPGNFDASKTSNVVGGKFDTTNNTFSFDEGVYSATYDYDVNYTGHSQISGGKFTLTYEAPEVPGPEPTEPEPTEPQPTEPEPTEPQPTEPTENPFTDVTPAGYFYKPVLWAVANNITSGVSDTEFGPYEACTRAQIATFLWAAAGRPDPETTENPFTDVKESDYFYKSVLWAAENGITSGVSDTEFGPHDVCTRAQAVTLLWAGEGKPVVESGTSFNDVEQGDYFYDAVQWAVKNNVTAGIGDGLFGPYDNCQRGQIVTFMYKTFA